MKTVLIISHRLGIGGTEKTIHYLSKYLLDHEWIVHVFCIGPKLEHPAMFFDPRITIINSNYQARCSPQLFLLISDLIRNIRSIKPDILLSFLSIPSILTIISNLFFHIPHIASERNNPILLPGQSRYWKFLRYLLYFRLNSLVVQSNVLAMKFREILVAPPPINVIRNAVQLIDKDTTNKRTFPVPPYSLVSKIRFLFLGRLEYQKGVDLLVQAFPDVYLNLLHKGISCELLIVGSGSMKSQLNSIIIEPRFFDAKHKIKMVPETLDIVKWFSYSDILVIPSRSEGFPNVLLEAWSFGLPVIASVASLAGTDINRGSVLIYHNSINGDLAEKMIDLPLSNNSLRSQLFCNAANELKNYDLSRILPQWLELLTKHSSNGIEY